jgi:hypothetical protein
MENKGTKRITRDKGYQRPDKTYQDKLSNQEIKEKLKEYKKVVDIRTVSIGTHIRYFSIDPKSKEKVFRLGGTLNKIDPDGKYVILSNGSVTWSVQIPNAIFFQKMSEGEFKEELKKEIKKELMTEMQNSEENVDELKKEIKNLKTKLENYKESIEQFKESEKELKKKNETLTAKIATIEAEIRKNKSKK